MAGILMHAGVTSRGILGGGGGGGGGGGPEIPANHYRYWGIKFSVGLSSHPEPGLCHISGSLDPDDMFSIDNVDFGYQVIGSNDVNIISGELSNLSTKSANSGVKFGVESSNSTIVVYVDMGEQVDLCYLMLKHSAAFRIGSSPHVVASKNLITWDQKTNNNTNIDNTGSEPTLFRVTPNVAYSNQPFPTKFAKAGIALSEPLNGTARLRQCVIRVAPSNTNLFTASNVIVWPSGTINNPSNMLDDGSGFASINIISHNTEDNPCILYPNIVDLPKPTHVLARHNTNPYSYYFSPIVSIDGTNWLSAGNKALSASSAQTQSFMTTWPFLQYDP